MSVRFVYLSPIEVKPEMGPLLECPENFSHTESHSKISDLIITELFYSRI